MNFRKGFLTLAIAVIIMAMACPAFALYESPNKIVHTYICTNTSTVAYGKTAISTSVISPINNRILGYSIMPYDNKANSEFVVGLYDDTTCNIASYILDEAELGANDDKAPRWLPYPAKLARGLSVWQGMNTVVIIYYEDAREF